ncbi:ceramide kinase-like [Salmo salar]|uniref:Ceramide kinase-like n=1 Tax=Salmo salar TaxID=8030 RepID=A0ABM3F5B6_SALSA|nr:ceramide kinase-like [Salmo salar]
MSFVEVRRFRFVPKHSNVISELDPSETSGKRICNQVCTAHPSYDTGHSNWNCDGKILPHAAIRQCSLPADQTICPRCRKRDHNRRIKSLVASNCPELC